MPKLLGTLLALAVTLNVAHAQGDDLPVLYIVIYSMVAEGEANQTTLAQHIGYQTQLFDDGVLFLGGPLEGPQQQGMAMLQADSLQHARQIAEADPAVASGGLRIDSIRELGVAAHRSMGESSAASVPSMQPGQIVHVELASTDLARSEEFYSSLFGWSFTAMDDNYVLFMDAGGKLGGGFSTMLEAGSGTVVYLLSPDINATLAAVTAAGGTVVSQRTEIPGIGFYAVFSDPDGNPIGLFGQ